MERYEVRVRIAASQGGQVETVVVEADDTPSAIMKAALKLDDKGLDRWSLVKCSKVTS